MRAPLGGVLTGLLLVAVLGLALSSLSYATALRLKSEDTFAPVTNTVLLPMLLLSGILLPMSLAPDWPHALPRVKPFVYVVDAERGVSRRSRRCPGGARRRLGALGREDVPTGERLTSPWAGQTPRAGDNGEVHVRVAVVGAGFAGLGMAVRLVGEGIDDFLVFDRGDDVGGTWRDNTYPGCSCDVPSNLYSFSFAPNPDWSSSFPQQPEIHRYLADCVDRFGLEPHLRLGHDVLDARWDDSAGRWVLETSRGTFTATVLVCGTGPLSEPSIPAVPGLAEFEGAAFHSARWAHDVDLRGARVAVIGTGASAVQFVPEIAPDVAALHLFQRTPPWILPRVDHMRRPLENRLFRAFPAVQRWLRAASYWGRESTLVALARPRLMRVAEVLARAHLRRQVANPELRAALTPDYTLGCKRVIVSSTFYPALQRSGVELVTAPLAEVRATSVVAADGTEREVDVIVFGTGFQAAEPPVARRLHGRGGRRLSSEWAGGAQAYLGTAVAGFPNLFLLVGPGSGPGHNSTVLAIESQVGYVLDALRAMAERGLATVEVRPQAQAAFAADVQDRMAGTVWTTGGCTSWYLDGRGRNTTLWPGSIRRFRRLTRRFDPENYLLRPRPALLEAGA